MKTPLIVIIVVIVGMLGLLLVYSQTGIPKGPEGAQPAAPAYGGGAVTESIDYETVVVLIILYTAVLLSSPLRGILSKKKD